MLPRLGLALAVALVLFQTPVAPVGGVPSRPMMQVDASVSEQAITAPSGVGPPCTLDELLRGAAPQTQAGSDDEPTVSEALRRLAVERQRWRTAQPRSYRLCMITLNALHNTVMEVDVELGRVVVARQAAGYDAIEGRIDPDAWSPSAGLIVEDLFDQLQDDLTSSRDWDDNPGVHFVVLPTYDARAGYPVYIYSGPGKGSAVVFDADVSTLVRLTPSPTVLLTPPSLGEIYGTPKRGRIRRPLSVYETLLGVTGVNPTPLASDGWIRDLWPDLAPAILARGNRDYWRHVHWQPARDLVGRVLGTFKHPSFGQSLYLMSFSHNGEELYAPIAIDAIELID